MPEEDRDVVMRQKSLVLVLSKWQEYVQAIDKAHPDEDWWAEEDAESHAYDFALHMQYGLWAEDEEDKSQEELATEVRKNDAWSHVSLLWNEYVTETEHQDGSEIWLKWSKKEIAHDFLLYAMMVADIVTS